MGHMPGEPPPPPGTGAGQQVASSRGRLAAVLVKREAPSPRGSFAPLLRSLGLRTHARTRTRTCECTDGRTRTETSTRTQVAGQDHMTTPSVTTCHVNYPFRQNEFSAPPSPSSPSLSCRRESPWQFLAIWRARPHARPRAYGPCPKGQAKTKLS